MGEVRDMSRKEMKELAEAIPHIPAEIGPALKMFGSVIQDAWMNTNGVYLDKDERKGHSPIAEVIDTDLEIRIKGKVIRFQPATQGKAVITIPVGMSDKVSTATIPRDWTEGQFAAALVEVFEGDPYVLNILVDRMCEAIDSAAIINEETGRLKIQQDLLPPVRHAVAVAEALDRLKRSFKTQSAGSPSVNLSFTIEDIEEPKPSPVPVMDAKEIAKRVAALTTPVVAGVELAPIEDKYGGGDISHTYTEPADEVHQESSYKTSDDSDIYTDLILEALEEYAGSYPDGLTMGQIKKLVPQLKNKDSKVLTKIMNTLCDEERVVKTGIRRSSRYQWINQDADLIDNARGLPTLENDDVIDEYDADAAMIDFIEGTLPMTDEAGETVDVPVMLLTDTSPSRPAPSWNEGCVMCDLEGQFKVEDLPNGERWFCTEKHYAEYVGLPVYEEGYYGLGQPKVGYPVGVSALEDIVVHDEPAPAPQPTSMSEALGVAKTLTVSVASSDDVARVMSGSQLNNPTKKEE
tara:strand:+ start:1404 stop:2963 length:1560 start_codon:yes stop_codon:yes gene_type:complete